MKVGSLPHERRKSSKNLLEREQLAAQYIFDVNYDSKILTTRAQRQSDAMFVINPAFRDAIGIAPKPEK